MNFKFQFIMKKSPLAVFLLCFTQMLLAQDLFVGSDSSLTLESGSQIAINGLELSPSSNYTVVSNTNIARSSEAANTGNISILRHYSVSESLNNYQGALVFNYQDNELNGTIESELVLQLFGTDLLWQSYPATLDTNANTLSYNFATGVSFSIVTADNTETLDLESPEFMNQFVIYPNPTSDVVHIKYPYRVQTTLHNMLGQVLQQGRSHTVNLSLYEEATYFLTINDPINNQTKTFKIIKK